MAPSVLLVEDEPAVAVTLREILAQEGYEVHDASSTLEALAKLDSVRFDVALLDLCIGDESGLTVLAQLRQRSPETVALILTGYGSLETAVQAMRHGASDYLLKPCDVRELKAALARGLEQCERARRVAAAEAARQELERVLRARDDFLAVVAHELRTPLSVVIGWAQYVQRQLARGAYDGATERLDVLVGQARRLARLVDDFLDVARIQNGVLKLNLARFDLRALAERAVRDARSAFPTHEFRLQLGPREVPVLIDALRLGQVLGNLLENAAKFSPMGGPVSVRVDADEREGRVAVTDQGVGIPEAELGRIFECFYQGERDIMSRRFGGIGAGLYLSRALVEAHGGRIWAESAGPSRGATLTVALPLAHTRSE